MAQYEGIQQHTPEWHQKRSNIITATNIASILKLNPFENSDQLLKKKRSKDVTPITNKAMRHGQFFEDVADSFDMGEKYSKVLLDRTDKVDTPTDMNGTRDWNTIARNLNVMFQEKGIRDLGVKLSTDYRVSKYMVEGERGFMIKVF